jgi:glyoxylase-like metal-dependent hydrolase (beta-lactamase superfamily II)
MSEWLSEMPEVEEVRPGIWSIPLPVPGPLVYVGVFALVGDDGFLLVDAGWNSPDQHAALAAGLRQAGGSIGDITGIAVTHFHGDHYGMAGRLREESGAWIALHRDDASLVSVAERPDAERMRTWLLEWAVEPGELDDLLNLMEQMAAFSEGVLPDRLLDDGDEIRGAGRLLRTLHTPGHSPGHVIFVDDDAKVVFTGDHLLARTTPNISVLPDSDDDPLAAYLGSLAQSESLRGYEALPGHEERFEASARAREILAHHDEQLRLVLDLVADGAETVRDIASRMPWLRSWDTFGPFDIHSALGESHAHLRTLERRGELEPAGGTPLRWRIPTGKKVSHAR